MICGIELKGSELIFVVLDSRQTVIETSFKKIELVDSDNSDSVKIVANEIFKLFLEYNFKHVFIKKRAKKGKFAGGPDSFKIEGLIQYLATCPVMLISTQLIKAYEKENNVNIPPLLKKYQETAFICAVVGMYS